MKNLLILGCGWLAEELAHDLKKNGWQVWVTTTNSQKYHRLLNDGIFANLHDFDRDLPLDLPIEVHFDVILNSIPASKKNSENEIEWRFYRLFNLLSSISYNRHIFLSSIGVYPDRDGVFDETYDDEEQMSRKLRIAELKMFSLPFTSIFRLGGLFGKNRIFAKYFQDKEVSIGNQTSNFVHLDDVIAVLKKFFDFKGPNSYYNIVCPEHPSKKEVIEASAQKYFLNYPSSYVPQNDFQKIVISDKIIELLNYTFKYRSPTEF